ncbi:MAG: GNAT family N-acetyltransferase [Melioribacteraceae bacterium]
MNSIIVKTGRLEIISGSLEHIKAELKDLQELSRLLDAEIPADWPPPLNDEQSQNYFLKYAEEHPDTRGYSFWYIILPENGSRKLIGGIGFKGEPDEKGAIEIGYSILENRQCNGYAPEAVAGLVKWAFNQEGVKSVIAETLLDGIGSQKVLLKNGFRLASPGSEDGVIRFELSKKYIKL